MCSAIKATAEHGEAELWVFHSSRLARGDGRKGRRGLGKIVHDLRYEDVVVRGVADPEMVSPMPAGIGEKVGNQYATDLSAHTKRGMRQRKADGKPVGAMPSLGYTTEVVTDKNGAPLERNVAS